LTQPGWEDAADYFRDTDKKYSKSELRVPAVVQPQTADDAAAPVPTIFGELTECLDIVLRISHMLQGTSRPGSSHIRLGSVKPQWNMSIPSLEPAKKPDSSMLLKGKPVEPVNFDPCVEPPAIDHIDFGFGQRHGDGCCACGQIDTQTVIFDVKSQ